VPARSLTGQRVIKRGASLTAITVVSVDGTNTAAVPIAYS
jgi:hypothetical protein